jgi:hypothetical protein
MIIPVRIQAGLSVGMALVFGIIRGLVHATDTELMPHRCDLNSFSACDMRAHALQRHPPSLPYALGLIMRPFALAVVVVAVCGCVATCDMAVRRRLTRWR